MLTYSLSAVVAAYAAVDLWVGVLSWPEQCLVSLHTLSSEPSGMFDDAGSEFKLVGIAVRNQTSGGVSFDGRHLEAEARFGDEWKKVPSPGPLTGIPPRSETQEIVLIPNRAEGYRMRFRYCFSLGPLAEQRLLDWAFHNFPVLKGPNIFGRFLVYHRYET